MSDLFNEKARLYRTYAEIDLDKIRHNGRVIKKCFPDQRILCVMKADAYGHGIEGILPATETFADAYAVATVEEGLRIRAHADTPTLLFGPVPEGRMAEAAENDLTFTVGSAEYAERLDRALREKGLTAKCQLKIDTGLCRSGVRFCDETDFLTEIGSIFSHDTLNFVGAYTHFACGDGGEDWETQFTARQFEKYERACRLMEENGFPVGLRHCASTGASLVHPAYRLDMVRLGMMPLGMSYSDESVSSLGLLPAMRWASFVVQTKRIEAGDAVSYGCTFRAERPMRIAMLSCGYADGYRRVYSNKTEVILCGKRVPVIGRVAMDYMIVDVTDLPEAEVGSEAVLLGDVGDERVSAQELSAIGESVSGEVTCMISPRVPRIYINVEGK